MKTAQAFDGEDGAVLQQPSCPVDGLGALGQHPLPIPQFHPGAAIGTGVRLGMESTVARIVVFAFAGWAQAKLGHGGVGPVVRNVLDDGVARSAIGAIGEGVPIAAVGGVAQVGQAVRAGGDIRRNEHELAGGILRIADRKLLIANRFEMFDADLVELGQGRRFAAQRSLEAVERLFRAFHFDHDA